MSNATKNGGPRRIRNVTPNSERPAGIDPNRLKRAIIPIAAGLLLDAADLVTFSSVGVRFGWLVGAIVAFCLAHAVGIKGRGMWFATLIGAAYCTIPGTSFLPLATVISAVAAYKADPLEN